MKDVLRQPLSIELQAGAVPAAARDSLAVHRNDEWFTGRSDDKISLPWQLLEGHNCGCGKCVNGAKGA